MNPPNVATDTTQPPPPMPNLSPSAPAALAEPAQPTEPGRALNAACLVLAVAMVMLGFAVGLGISDNTARALGRGFGTPFLPVVVSALIGWGNERRARIAFLVVGGLVTLLLLPQLLIAT